MSAFANAYDDKRRLTAAKIINEHMAAVGGKEALARLKSRVAIGTVKKENEPEAQMAIISEAPNRVSALYVFQNYNWQLTYDKGNVIFRPTITRDASVIEGKYRDILATGAMFNSISLYNLLTDAEASDVKMEAKGIKKVKNRPAYVVEIKRGKIGDFEALLRYGKIYVGANGLWPCELFEVYAGLDQQRHSTR